MNFSQKYLAPISLSFAMMAGNALADEAPANTNEAGFSCDAPDLSQEPALQDRIDTIMAANVVVGVPRLFADPSINSGFIVDRSGYIVTSTQNLSALRGQVNVYLYDQYAYDNEGEKIEAEIVGVDDMLGIAVLKIETETRLSCVNIADSSKVRVGDDAFIISSPLRLGYSLSSGIISNTRRAIAHEAQGANGLYDFFQTDAATNNGSAGAALYNEFGAVIGMMSASLNNQPNMGINFAVQANDLRESIDEIIRFGAPQRPGMGISMAPVTEEIARANNLSGDSGVVVQSVAPGMSADIAGIREGDIILEIEGEAMNNPLLFSRKIISYEPGDTIALRIMRDRILRTIEVTLVDRNAAINALTQPEETPEGVNPTDVPSTPAPAVPPSEAPEETPAPPEAQEDTPDSTAPQQDESIQENNTQPPISENEITPPEQPETNIPEEQSPAAPQEEESAPNQSDVPAAPEADLSGEDLPQIDGNTPEPEGNVDDPETDEIAEPEENIPDAAPVAPAYNAPSFGPQ